MLSQNFKSALEKTHILYKANQFTEQIAFWVVCQIKEDEVCLLCLNFF